MQRNDFKRPINILLCLVAAVYEFGVAQSPISFFPHQVGNVWQYRYTTFGVLAWTERFDSAFASSQTDIFIRARITEYDPPTNYSSWYLIRDSNVVYQDNTPREPVPHLTKRLYVLDAALGQVWVVRYMTETDTLYREVAKVTTIDTSVIFGDTVVTMHIIYGITDASEPDTVWWDARTLAKRFGLIYAEIEPRAPVQLAGAIIDSIRWGIIVSAPELMTVPNGFTLEQNFPNPFNPSTTIRFSVPQRIRIKLSIFDVLGRQIRILRDQILQEGTHEAVWDASSNASGIYFYRLEGGGATITRKMIVQK